MHPLHIPPRTLLLATLASLGLSAACSGDASSAGDMANAGPGGSGFGPGAVGTVPGVAQPGGTVPGGAGTTTTPGSGSTPVGAGTAPVTAGPTPTTGVTPTGVGGGPGVQPPNPDPMPVMGADCVGTGLAASKRIVRLSFNQIANTIGSLLDPALTPQLATDNAILDSKHRAFPPLQSPREGGVVTDVQWTTIDAMTSEAADYVLANFDAVTGCGAAPTDACAQGFVSTFAERAYRRPLSADEQTRVNDLYAQLETDDGATIQEATQNSVYAILQAPQFLYRTELGDDWTTDGPMSQYELASALSYFLTDDMPDQMLLDAAAQNALATSDQVAAQVDRILQTDAAKANLQDAMLSYFNYQGLENVVIQDPGFTDGVRNSMFHEGELFLKNTLWGGQLNDLLLAKTSVVNDGLANIYGITPFPPPGATVDADGFAQVDLPADRSGIVTMPGFLSTRSRPTDTSVVGRGLLIRNAFLCTDTPPPPADLADAIAAATSDLAGETARKQSEYRQTTSPCSTCHGSFDPYGVALENYDLVGRYRTEDDQGRPIDPSVTLPAQIGGGDAMDMVDVANKIAGTGAFTKCMGRNLINYALADTSAGAAEISSCAAQEVADSFAASGDATFSGLVRAVAASTTFSNRSQGAAQ